MDPGGKVFPVKINGSYQLTVTNGAFAGHIRSILPSARPNRMSPGFQRKFFPAMARAFLILLCNKKPRDAGFFEGSSCFIFS